MTNVFFRVGRKYYTVSTYSCFSASAGNLPRGSRHWFSLTQNELVKRIHQLQPDRFDFSTPIAETRNRPKKRRTTHRSRETLLLPIMIWTVNYIRRRFYKMAPFLSTRPPSNVTSYCYPSFKTISTFN